jgi:hypothetical protein
MKTTENPSLKIPSMDDFCLNVPLYRLFSFDDSDTETLNNMEFFRGHIDCYCMDCKQPSVFLPEEEYPRRRRTIGWYNDKDVLIECNLYCTRNDSHRIFFNFYIHNNTITKYGQYPSLADLSSVEILKYRKILDSQSYSEFSRAVGLASHGIGIGSFVYLRRIFENLIEDAHKIAKKSDDWMEEQYQKSRMEQKILKLKPHLPSFLAENKSLYSILGKGIHQLSEDDCLNAFPIMKLGIELILDEKMEQRERARKLKEAKSEINKLTSKIKSSGK